MSSQSETSKTSSKSSSSRSKKTPTSKSESSTSSIESSSQTDHIPNIDVENISNISKEKPKKSPKKIKPRDIIRSHEQLELEKGNISGLSRQSFTGSRCLAEAQAYVWRDDAEKTFYRLASGKSKKEVFDTQSQQKFDGFERESDIIYPDQEEDLEDERQELSDFIQSQNWHNISPTIQNVFQTLVQHMIRKETQKTEWRKRLSKRAMQIENAFLHVDEKTHSLQGQLDEKTRELRLKGSNDIQRLSNQMKDLNQILRSDIKTDLRTQDQMNDKIEKTMSELRKMIGKLKYDNSTQHTELEKVIADGKAETEEKMNDFIVNLGKDFQIEIYSNMVGVEEGLWQRGWENGLGDHFKVREEQVKEFEQPKLKDFDEISDKSLNVETEIIAVKKVANVNLKYFTQNRLALLENKNQKTIEIIEENRRWVEDHVNQEVNASIHFFKKKLAEYTEDVNYQFKETNDNLGKSNKQILLLEEMLLESSQRKPGLGGVFRKKVGEKVLAEQNQSVGSKKDSDKKENNSTLEARLAPKTQPRRTITNPAISPLGTQSETFNLSVFSGLNDDDIMDNLHAMMGESEESDIMIEGIIHQNNLIKKAVTHFQESLNDKIALSEARTSDKITSKFKGLSKKLTKLEQNQDQQKSKFNQVLGQVDVLKKQIEIINESCQEHFPKHGSKMKEVLQQQEKMAQTINQLTKNAIGNLMKQVGKDDVVEESQSSSSESQDNFVETYVGQQFKEKLQPILEQLEQNASNREYLQEQVNTYESQLKSQEKHFTEICMAILQTNGFRIKPQDLAAHRIFKEYDQIQKREAVNRERKKITSSRKASPTGLRLDRDFIGKEFTQGSSSPDTDGQTNRLMGRIVKSTRNIIQQTDKELRTAKTAIGLMNQRENAAVKEERQRQYTTKQNLSPLVESNMSDCELDLEKNERKTEMVLRRPMSLNMDGQKITSSKLKGQVKKKVFKKNMGINHPISYDLDDFQEDNFTKFLPLNIDSQADFQNKFSNLTYTAKDSLRVQGNQTMGLRSPNLTKMSSNLRKPNEKSQDALKVPGSRVLHKGRYTHSTRVGIKAQVNLRHWNKQNIVNTSNTGKQTVERLKALQPGASAQMHRKLNSDSRIATGNQSPTRNVPLLTLGDPVQMNNFSSLERPVDHINVREMSVMDSNGNITTARRMQVDSPAPIDLPIESTQVSGLAMIPNPNSARYSTRN